MSTQITIHPDGVVQIQVEPAEAPDEGATVHDEITHAEELEDTQSEDDAGEGDDDDIE